MLIVVVLGLIAGRDLLRPGYFNMHDDLQMMRQLAMEECFRDLQIPCRWTPHMGYGFGFPLFNYYPPLPYLIGEIFRVVGNSFVDAVKYTFLLSIVASGLTMYVLARELWGRLGGVVSSAFYIWAPYHSVDIFVRGAMNESWALVWFPLVLWSSFKVIKKAQFRYLLILALSLFSLLTSHNLMVMIFTPVLIAWVLYWLIRERSWSTAPQIIIFGIWALGLAAFFTIPAYLEKSLVHVETLVAGYYEYIAHFTSIDQLLFSRFWGYGPSAWQTEGDKMSFQIGHVHWILSLMLALFVLFRIIKTKKLDSLSILMLFFFAVGWFAAFMTQFRATPIWLIFDPFLKFLQFPWRFLTLAIFSFSVLAGSIVPLLGKEGTKNFFKFSASLALVLGVILFNKQYFHPEKMGPLTDQEKFSGAAWDLQQTAGIYDYLPAGAKTAPKEPQKNLAEIVNGNGSVSEMYQKTNWAKFKIKADSDNAVVRINIFKFPNWKVRVDGQEVETFINDDEWGRMHANISKGEHEVVVKLVDTQARKVGNIISVGSWIALLTVPLWRRKIS